jgi:hypothetical protein
MENNSGRYILNKFAQIFSERVLEDISLEERTL